MCLQGLAPDAWTECCEVCAGCHNALGFIVLSPDPAQAVAEYERLAAEVGGYSRLCMAVNTEPDELRGPRLEACLEALRVLKPRGIGGAFVWALDNSPASGYAAEAALLRLAAEPATAEPALPLSTSAAVPALHSADGVPPAAGAAAAGDGGCCCSLM